MLKKTKARSRSRRRSLLEAMTQENRRLKEELKCSVSWPQSCSWTWEASRCVEELLSELERERESESSIACELR